MKKLQLLLLICCLNFAAFAQVAANYTFSSSTGVYTALPTGTALTPAGGGISGAGWLCQVYNVSLPFVYYYNGKGFSSCYITSDGFVTFGAPPTVGNAFPLLPTAGENGAISAFGNQTQYTGGASLIDAANANPIIYNTIGTAPNRIFVVQWTSAMRAVTYNGIHSTTGESITFQIRLKETSNVAEIMYDASTTTQTAATVPYYPTVGITGSVSTDFITLSGTTWAGATTSTSNLASITFTSTAAIPTGLTYDFTPSATITPAACTGTPVAAIAQASQGITCGSVSLGLANLPLSTGLTYQWQSSATGQPNSWTSISGATDPSLTTTPTAATYYQCLVACGAGTAVASGAVVVGYESSCPVLPAYGIQTASFFSTYIASFSITGGTCGTSLVDNTLHIPNYGYTTFAGTSGVAYVYGDLTYAPSHVKILGSSTASTTVNAVLVSSASNSALANIWIDFNDNGIFGDVVSEKVGTATAITNAGRNITLTIPANSFGVHRMRVRTIFSGSYTTTSLTPTGLLATNGVGEARDYMVEITPAAPTVTGSLAGTQCVPPTVSDVLTATNVTGTTPVNYTWTGPNNYSVVTTNTNTTNLSVSAVAQNGTYSVVTTADGASSCTAGTLFVSVATNVAAPVAEPTAITMTPAATTATLNFTPDAAVPSGYLVLISTSATGPVAPANGTYYATGTYAPGGSGTPVVYAASSSTGNTPTFSFTGLTSNTQYYTYIYPFNVSCTGAQYEAPATTSFVTCAAAPGTPASSAVTSTSMTLSWTAAAAGGGVINPVTYQLNAYLNSALTIPAPGFPVTTGTALTYNATGLTPGTYYYFTVNSIGSCNSTSGILARTTSCATPASLPWLQTFENGASTFNLTPNCMNSNGNTGTYNVLINGVQNHTSGGTWFYLLQGNYFNSSVTYANQWLTTPQFALKAGTTYTISFWYQTDGNNWPAVNVEYSTSAALPSNTTAHMTGFTSIGSLTNVSNTTYQHFIQTFTVPADGNYTIGTNVQMGTGTVGTVGPTSNLDFVIDDIEICGAPSGRPTAGPVCAAPTPGTTTLSANFTNGTNYTTYTWTGAGAISTPSASTTSVTGTYATPGFSVYSVSAVNDPVTYGYGGYCAVANVTDTVFINQLPTSIAPVTSPSVACVGGTITLSGHVTGGTGAVFAWTGPTTGITDATQANTTIALAAAANAGAYTLTATAPGCTGSVTGNTNASPEVVNSLPSGVNPTVSPNPVCIGNTITLTGNVSDGAGLAYSWTGATTGITSSTVVNATIPSAVAANAGTYSLTVTAAGCVGFVRGNTNSTPLVVNQLPAAVTASVTPTPACVGGPITLTGGNTGGAGVTYAWTGPVTSHISSAGTESASITAAALTDAGTYTLTASAAGCTGTTVGQSAALVVNQLPTAITAIVTPNPACVGGALTLTGGNTGGSGVAYAWTGPVTGHISSANTESASITTAALNDAGIYTLTATAAGCTGSTVGQSAALVVNQLPAAVTASVSPNPACVSGTLTLTGSNTGGTGATYAWTGPVTGHISSANTESASITAAALTDAGIYTLTASAAGCTGTTVGQSAALVVNQLPTAVTASVSPNPACVGGALTLTGGNTGGSGVAYAWTGPVTGHISSANTESASITTAALNDAGTYTLTATAAGCTGSTAGQSAALVVNQLPTAVTASVTPNPVCVGSAVTLAGGNTGGTGVAYAWTGPAADITSAGTESASITSATTADAGTYTLTATAAGCTGTRTAQSSALIVNQLPTAVTASVSPTPACFGGTVTLTGGNTGGSGVVYAWTGPQTGHISSAGTENASITTAALNDAGTYTLTATAAGCTGSITGTAALVVNQVPTAVTASVSPNPACAGGTVTLTGGNTGGSGVTYAWTGPVNGDIASASSESTSITSAAAGDAGTYTLTATAAGCTGSIQNTTAALVVNTPPTAVAPATAPNPICVGFPITLTGNVTGGSGLTYAWSGPTAGIVNASAANTTITSASLANAGTYTLTVTAAGCAPVAGNTSANQQVVNTLPVIHTFTGGGGYCAGDTGVHAGLTISDTGISYQLYMGATQVNSSVMGTGSAIDFGLLTIPGVYYAVATDTHTTCTRTLSGITVFINPLPDTFTVIGGGSYCASGSGSDVMLTNSVSGISYQLYNGAGAVGTPMAGTGAALDFGLQTTGGTYTAMATNTITGCTMAMAGTATVTITPLPDTFTVTGGGSYCAGDAGLHIGLDNSVVGVNYQLYVGSGTVGSATPGTGAALDFGLQTAGGIYSVVATNATTTCVQAMPNTVTITVNPLPDVYNVQGGGGYCAGGTGSDINLSNSSSSVSYQLYNGTATVGTPVVGVDGQLDFGSFMAVGDYSVIGTNTTTGCISTMSDTVTVNINPVVTPSVMITTGLGAGDTVCAGSTVTLTAHAQNSGNTANYRWTLNNINVSAGTNDSTYTYIPAVGDVMIVRVRNNNECATVNTVRDTMNLQFLNPVAPSVFITVSPLTSIAQGVQVTLTANATNVGHDPIYQWYKNGALIPGATSNVYTNNNFHNRDSMSCEVVTTGACGGVITFNSVILTVFATGVTQVAMASDVKLVPNPNKGAFTVKGSMGTTEDVDATIEITDMLGQVVYSNKVTAKNGIIDTQVQLQSTLANGMYMLNLISKTGHTVFHFVIEQ